MNPASKMILLPCVAALFSSSASASTTFTDLDWFTDGALSNTYNGDPSNTFTWTVSSIGESEALGTAPRVVTFGTDSYFLISANQETLDVANPNVITHTFTFSQAVENFSLRFFGPVNSRPAFQLEEWISNFSIAPTSVTTTRTGPAAYNPTTGEFARLGTDFFIDDAVTWGGPLTSLSFDLNATGTDPNGFFIPADTTFQWQTVPEPSTALLLIVGSTGAVFRRRRPSLAASTQAAQGIR